MKNSLNYKEYYGSVEFSAEDDILYGNIIGVEDLITYEAESVSGLRASFIEAVKDYFEPCKAIGKKPDKFYKGVSYVRTSNTKHRHLAILAEKNKMKLNEVVNKAFDFSIKNEDEVLD